MYNKLLRFVEGYIPDKDEADNIVQNVFEKLWENRSSFVDDSNLIGWLFTVTKNECLSYISHLKVINNYQSSVLNRELNVNAQALNDLDFDNLNLFEIEDIIRDTLDRLPKRCREVFKLSRERNKRNMEIAEQLNISVKAVEAHISKALRMLKIALKDYL
jgi:RNA polymerase sigma-70 factor (ECF subfamily)